MSRTGKKPIAAVSGVTMTVKDRQVTVKGPKGEQSLTLMDIVNAKQTGEGIVVEPANDTKEANAAWGTTRALIANMVKGVTDGYEQSLELVGVGYRAAMKGSNLSLQLGFSHDVDIAPPEGVKFETPKQTEIKISGIDKQLVGETAAKIRKIRPPEPYKGKGVKYAGETVRRKEGKKK